MVHEVTIHSMLDHPLVALGAAFMKLMRIIPDSMSGYSGAPVTVKRYLLTGAATAFCAPLSGATRPFFLPHPHPLVEGKGIGSGAALSNPDSVSSQL
jgi:hypothetical protein